MMTEQKSGACAAASNSTSICDATTTRSVTADDNTVGYRACGTFTFEDCWDERSSERLNGTSQGYSAAVP
jgi:hypothetical protein